MGKEKLNIDLQKKVFKAELVAIALSEGKSQILYIPSLDISSYGDNLDEANKMLKVCLDEFSKNLLELSQSKIDTILNSLGWEKHKYFKKRHSNLSEITIDDIIAKFDLPKNTKAERIPIAV